MTLRLGHPNVRYVSPLNQSEMYSYDSMPYLRVYRKMCFYACDVEVWRHVFHDSDPWQSSGLVLERHSIVYWSWVSDVVSSRVRVVKHVYGDVCHIQIRCEWPRYECGTVATMMLNHAFVWQDVFRNLWLTLVSWSDVKIPFDTMHDRMWQSKTGWVPDETSMLCVLGINTTTICYVQ